MDTVLGLNVTATNVQTVLVEGRDAAGATLEHDELDVFSGAVSRTRASEQVAEAVLTIAQANGHQLRAIGVTWSRAAELEASLVLDSLAGLGFENVVPVQLPRAAEALARGIGKVIGYRRTAVCVVEPDAVVLALVDTVDGEVETVVNPPLADGQLPDWLGSMFDRDDWSPEGLFVVGSVGGLDALAARLRHRLGIPVFDPPEAELALAHGAALASARSPLDLGPACGYPGTATHPDPRRPLRVPLTMLAGGAVTLVVSSALAISPQLLPARQVPPAVSTHVRADIPTQVPAPAEVVAPMVVVPPPVIEPPTALDAPEPADAAPAHQSAPPTAEAVAPEEPITEFRQIVPPPAVEPPPAEVVTPPVIVPQVPAQKPRLRDRILDKIPGLDRLRN